MQFASLITLLCLTTSLSLRAQSGPWTWQESLVPDPGFALDGAQVIRVTTLADKGKGSLREALRAKGPRLIVFEVAGVIELDKKSLDSKEPQAYIAGQTAPEPGITIIKGGLTIEGSQTVVQHLRIRPGDAGLPKKSGWEPDGITTSGGPVDVWIDHCSVSWALDEQISASTYDSPTGLPAHRIQITHCIMAEGLNDSTHGKGPHSKGTLVLDGTKQVAIVGNLFSSNVERNPVFKLDTSGVVVNNIITNPGQRAIHASMPDSSTGTAPLAKISIVGNLVLLGKESKSSAGIFEGAAEGYFKDNEGYFWDGRPLSLLRKEFPTLEQPPVWPDGLQARSPAAALWQVVRFAGARPAKRDGIDQRIVQQAVTGTARIIDSQEDVGGYPTVAPVTRPLKVPDKDRRTWLEALTREVTLGDANAKKG